MSFLLGDVMRNLGVEHLEELQVCVLVVLSITRAYCLFFFVCLFSFVSIIVSGIYTYSHELLTVTLCFFGMVCIVCSVIFLGGGGGGGGGGGQGFFFCVFSMWIAEDWPMYKGVLQEQKHNNLPLIEIGKLLVVCVMLCVCVFVTVCLCIVCVWQSAYMYLLHCPYALSSSNHLYPCEYCTPWPTIEILLLTLQFTSTVFLWPAFVMFWDLENNVFS